MTISDVQWPVGAVTPARRPSCYLIEEMSYRDGKFGPQMGKIWDFFRLSNLTHFETKSDSPDLYKCDGEVQGWSSGLNMKDINAPKTYLKKSQIVPVGAHLTQYRCQI